MFTFYSNIYIEWINTKFQFREKKSNYDISSKMIFTKTKFRMEFKIVLKHQWLNLFSFPFLLRFLYRYFIYIAGKEYP